MADLIVANAYVVTLNRGRQIYSDGAIAIEGNSIVAVGPTAEVLKSHDAVQVIDAEGMIAIPGLIDGHHHPNQYLSNGIGDDVDIFTLLYKRLYPYEAALTPEQAYLSALGGFVEAWPFILSNYTLSIKWKTLRRNRFLTSLGNTLNYC